MCNVCTVVYATLHYVTLCDVMLHNECVVLCHVMPCHAMPRPVMHGTLMLCLFMFWYAMLHAVAMPCSVTSVAICIYIYRKTHANM